MCNLHRDVSVGEAMVAFKGTSTLKQYMAMKPVKWGFKVWMLADANTGYVSEFEVYTGKVIQLKKDFDQGLSKHCANWYNTGTFVERGHLKECPPCRRWTCTPSLFGHCSWVLYQESILNRPWPYYICVYDIGQCVTWPYHICAYNVGCLTK